MKIVILAPQVAGYLDSVRHAAPEADVVEVSDDEELLGEVADAEILFTGPSITISLTPPHISNGCKSRPPESTGCQRKRLRNWAGK